MSAEYGDILSHLEAIQTEIKSLKEMKDGTKPVEVGETFNVEPKPVV